MTWSDYRLEDLIDCSGNCLHRAGDGVAVASLPADPRHQLAVFRPIVLANSTR